MPFSLEKSVYCALLTNSLLALAIQAEEPKNEYGLQANVLLGVGKPANDILGVGLIGRRYLDNGWFIGRSLDTYAYDFERPASYLGISQDPNVNVIDADASATVLGGFAGQSMVEEPSIFSSTTVSNFS